MASKGSSLDILSIQLGVMIVLARFLDAGDGEARCSIVGVAAPLQVSLKLHGKIIASASEVGYTIQQFGRADPGVAVCEARGGAASQSAQRLAGLSRSGATLVSRQSRKEKDKHERTTG